MLKKHGQLITGILFIASSIITTLSGVKNNIPIGGALGIIGIVNLAFYFNKRKKAQQGK